MQGRGWAHACCLGFEVVLCFMCMPLIVIDIWYTIAMHTILWALPWFLCFLESKYVDLCICPRFTSFGSLGVKPLFVCLFVALVYSYRPYNSTQSMKKVLSLHDGHVGSASSLSNIVCVQAGILPRFVGASHYEIGWQWCKPPSVTKCFDESFCNMILLLCSLASR